MGKNVAAILRFLMRYGGWTTYADDRATNGAVDCLEKLGFAETNGYRQVRLRRNYAGR